MRFAPRIALVRRALSACAVKTNTIYHIFSGLSKLLPNGFAKFALKFKYAAKRARGALYSAFPRQKFRRCCYYHAVTLPQLRRNFARCFAAAPLFCCAATTSPRPLLCRRTRPRGGFKIYGRAACAARPANYIKNCTMRSLCEPLQRQLIQLEALFYLFKGDVFVGLVYGALLARLLGAERRAVL